MAKKLIGNPDGYGVAFMESNLAAVSIVKKTPKKKIFCTGERKGQMVFEKD